MVLLAIFTKTSRAENLISENAPGRDRTLKTANQPQKCSSPLLRGALRKKQSFASESSFGSHLGDHLDDQNTFRRQKPKKEDQNLY